MRRSTMLVLVAVGAALVGFAFASDRLRHDDSTATEGTAARPQVVKLSWRESEGPSHERLVFSVHRFRVLDDGWRAEVSVTNDSKLAFEVAKSRREFGLMLFSTGEHDELDRRNNDRTLPTLRPALTYDPALPSVFEPSTTWTGTISARGALVAGGWVRFVFGTFAPIGRAPDTLPDQIVWITDHAYRLRG